MRNKIPFFVNLYALNDRTNYNLWALTQIFNILENIPIYIIIIYKHHIHSYKYLNIYY